LLRPPYPSSVLPSALRLRAAVGTSTSPSCTCDGRGHSVHRPRGLATRAASRHPRRGGDDAATVLGVRDRLAFHGGPRPWTQDADLCPRGGRASLDGCPGRTHARGLPPRARTLGRCEHARRERPGACRAVRCGRPRHDTLVAGAVAAGYQSAARVSTTFTL